MKASSIQKQKLLNEAKLPKDVYSAQFIYSDLVEKLEAVKNQRDHSAGREIFTSFEDRGSRETRQQVKQKKRLLSTSIHKPRRNSASLKLKSNQSTSFDQNVSSHIQGSVMKPRRKKQQPTDIFAQPFLFTTLKLGLNPVIRHKAKK